MDPRWTRRFQRLPAPAQTLAASAHGARLRWWRYGRDTDDLVAQAHERDLWDEVRWATWTAETVAQLLAHAARSVPWYRAHWEAQGRGGADAAPDELAAWPVVRKQDVQADPGTFVSEHAPGHRFTDTTSGTSGTPLVVEASRATLHRWFALHEARARGWHGVSRHDRWAILGGQQVVPGDRVRPPFWVHNRSGGQLYLSAQHVAPWSAAAYGEALERWQPTHLVAYPTMAAQLASALVDEGISLDGPGLVLANAEQLTDGVRALVAEAFGAVARETYGMAEMAGGATECPEGTLHWWPDAGLLEVLDDDDQPVAPGGSGRLVLTGLVNHDQVLIRYDVGDRGRGLLASGCACGRGLPVLAPVEGRTQDVLVLPHGRRLFWVNPIFAGLPVRQAQVVQDEVDRVSILVVPAPAWSPASAQVLADRAAERMGRGVKVEVHLVDHIAPGPSGKARPVVSRC
jgi:phenylacetate-CoA ligase